MSKLVWDKAGEHFYETGVKNVVLYPMVNSTYPKGVVWNGITGITEKPSGAEATALYADDTKYLNLISNEDFGATVEAYTYPDEFAKCDGSAAIATGVEGVMVGQQGRQAFGLCYRTAEGNDQDGADYGYKLHLVYGCTATPSEKSYATINDSPEAITFSWEMNTVPVEVPGLKPTSIITIDSKKVGATKMAALEDVLYGTDAGEGSQGTDARLPLPAEIITLLANAG